MHYSAHSDYNFINFAIWEVELRSSSQELHPPSCFGNRTTVARAKAAPWENPPTQTNKKRIFSMVRYPCSLLGIPLDKERIIFLIKSLLIPTVKSPPVGQTLGSDEPPEGQTLVTNHFSKKKIATAMLRAS
jgi:hypothetical protein